MKRLWLVPSLAAAAIAAGCGSNPPSLPPQAQGQGQGTGWQTCTDQQGRVVDERQCDPHRSGYSPMLYRWYYYPWGGRPYPIGYGVPLGGSYSDQVRPGIPTLGLGASGGSVAGPRTGVVRGGFGQTGSGTSAGT
jgi:hypothetical protein